MTDKNISEKVRDRLDEIATDPKSKARDISVANELIGRMADPVLKARIDGRKHAEELIAMIEIPQGILNEPHAADFQRACWQTFRDKADKVLGPAQGSTRESPSRPVMTDAEAKRYESMQINGGRGEYGHHTIGDCPEWLLERKATEAERLLSYLRSERGQRRQGD